MAIFQTHMSSQHSLLRRRKHTPRLQKARKHTRTHNGRRGLCLPLDLRGRNPFRSPTSQSNPTQSSLLDLLNHQRQNRIKAVLRLPRPLITIAPRKLVCSKPFNAKLPNTKTKHEPSVSGKTQRLFPIACKKLEYDTMKEGEEVWEGNKR